MTEDRTREFRLRRQAQSLGLRISKTRSKLLAPWSVAKLGTGEFVLGSSWGGASLDEVEAYLNTSVP